jgi:periplasmic divalent cation tolerance protein
MRCRFCGNIYSEKTMSEIMILSTTDTPELAREIAAAIVEAGEAACVNIVPGIRSIYRWQGDVQDESECLLLIKSTSERFEMIRSIIRRLHTYETPEVIAIPVTAGDPDYLAWLHSSLTNPSGL